MAYTVYGARGQFLDPAFGRDFYFEVTAKEGGQDTVDRWVEGFVPGGPRMLGRVWRPTIWSDEHQRHIPHGDWIPKDVIAIQLYTRINDQHRPGETDKGNGNPVVISGTPGRRYRR